MKQSGLYALSASIFLFSACQNAPRAGDNAQSMAPPGAARAMPNDDRAPASRTVQTPAERGGDARTVEAFRGIDVRGAFQVKGTVSANAATPVTIRVQADAALLPYVLTRLQGDTLVIDFDHREARAAGIDRHGEIALEFAVPALDVVRNSGSSDIAISGIRAPDLQVHNRGSGNIELAANSQRIDAHIRGSGQISLSGQTTTLEASISGSGDLHARPLQAYASMVTINGSGDAEVCATESVAAHVNGSGDVRYYCQPGQVSRRVNGSGDVQAGE